MTVPFKYRLIAVLSVLALFLSACGAAANQPTIATAVAQTVEAQNTLSAQSTPTEMAAATNTPLPLVTAPPLATKAPPTAPPTGGSLCTASASFVSETIPDGTITAAGSTFTKIWRIKNTGTCSWDSSWKFVYVSGDLMGGSSFYNFPQPTAPGDTVDVPVVFTAPQDGGSYRGYWKIKSPWGLVFGDSGSGNPFWVDIVVGSGTPANSKTETAYGITNVTYEVSRTCTQANTFYTITAYISSNGPVTGTYTWVQSDGNNKANNQITFTSAATKSVTRDWSQHIGSSENPRWAQVIVTDPNYHEYPQVTLPPLCW
jgi:hypothetical protein